MEATTALPPLEPRAPAVHARRARRRRVIPSTRTLEATLIWVLFAGGYFYVGQHVVVQLHLVNFDSLSRLAHAYFVWYNDPAKLAAIGFVWPPLQTLVLLPFAAIVPLATSLAAMPAASAVFMAGTMTVINFALRACEVPWFARYPLLLAFGLNPMIVYYGANGMAEAVYLYFLSFGIYFLIRWAQHEQTHLLAFVGIGMAFGALSRYELVPFAMVIGAGIAFVVLAGTPRGERARALESSLILYLAPVVYFGMAWLFFNWLILGNPLYFLTFGATTADVSTSQIDQTVPSDQFGMATLAVYLVKLNYALLPLMIVVVPALLFTAVVRRSPMAAVLAALVGTNAMVTFLLYTHGPDTNLLQMRYNMRGMPISMLGVAWLYYVWKPRVIRAGICLGALAVLLLSYPVTWRTMQSYAYQYEESSFVRALQTGRDQEGTVAISGYPIGIEDEQRMADHVKALPPDAVTLTDDAQSLGVMLLSGEPNRIFDRIDHGDDIWTAALENPWGRIDYLLVSTDERCRKPCVDLARNAYPGILNDQVPGMKVVFRTGRYALISVADRQPGGPRPPDYIPGVDEALK